MTLYKRSILAITLMAISFSVCHANPEVPDNITTPDVVKTQTVGELNFNDGYPTDDTLSKVQRYMLVQRAVNVFVDGIPISSMQAILEGLKSIGGKPNKSVSISEDLFDANSLWLTPNTTTPYIMIGLNVKDKPVILDVRSPVLGLIDDAFFKFVGDVGLGNPKDGGKGAKYLVAHDSYKGKIPKGHIVLRTPTYRNWAALRLNSVDDIAKFKKTFKMYPMGGKSEVDYINFSGVKMNTVHANNEDFYHELNEVIQYEPETAGDPHFRGLAAEIGIIKGQKFEPKGKHLEALKEAAAIANVHARNEAFRPTNRASYVFGESRQWFLPFGSTMSHEFKQDGRLFVDDRTAFHYNATGITPLMTAQFDGKGSSYLVTTADSNNVALRGDEVYTITLPPNPPMKRFWSFMVYDNQTRSILSTDQRSGGFDSKGDVVTNKDGSVTVTFAADKPEDKSNWVQTVPGKGFFVMYRMYSPTQDWHDRKWVIGDLIKK
jgi:hypothetical protein